MVVAANAIRLTEVTSTPNAQSLTESDGRSTRCHRPPPDAMPATMYVMLLHQSVNSRLENMSGLPISGISRLAL